MFPVTQMVKNPPAMQETQFDPWVRNIPWRRDRLPTTVFLGFPGSSAGKESTCNIGDPGSNPGSGTSPGEGNSYPLQYSDLDNSMDYTVHRVVKSWTQLSDFPFHTPSYQNLPKKRVTEYTSQHCRSQMILAE